MLITSSGTYRHRSCLKRVCRAKVLSETSHGPFLYQGTATRFSGETRNLDMSESLFLFLSLAQKKSHIALSMGRKSIPGRSLGEQRGSFYIKLHI